MHRQQQPAEQAAIDSGAIQATGIRYAATLAPYTMMRRQFGLAASRGEPPGRQVHCVISSCGPTCGDRLPCARLLIRRDPRPKLVWRAAG